jgi:disulfide bond formation protein DsbB
VSRLDLRAGALLVAWVVALAATLGALFVGEVLGQEPCTLCWYQRIAMFPLAVILGVACLVDDRGAWRHALPLALAGLGVAAWHSGLYLGLIPEPIMPCSRSGPSCTDAAMTIGGVLPLPVLSLAAFALIVAALVAAAWPRNPEPAP